MGQQILRSKCVLLSTAKTARNRMTTWRNQNIGCSLAVKLDVGDLGGRLDVTQRALAGTLSDRVKEATFHVIAVGAVSMWVPTNAWNGVLQIFACWSSWM